MLLKRVLLVDDYEPFCQLVRSLLQQRADFHVIGQASDGLEAVQKAAELNPDLILLDIGLPRLNGLEVARRLRLLTPETRIVILSQESSSDIVREALQLGAMAYVHKVRIHSELPIALEAVLAGKQFVSSNSDGLESTESTAAQGPHQHELLVYSDEVVLVESFARFVAAALRAGNSAILNATKSHLDYVFQALKAEGLDVDRAIQEGSYVPMDVANMPSTILEDGWPELAHHLEAAFKAAKSAHPRVALCGEGTARLWAEGQENSAIRIEHLCNDLTKTYDVDILCAFPANSFRGEEREEAFRSICAQHSAVHSG